MSHENRGIIVELTVNDLVKCSSFWDIPTNGESYRLEELMKSGARKAFAYQLGENFVGGCALSIRDEDCGHLSYFDVTPRCRNQGIGSCLLDFAEEYFRNLGMKRMRLNVYKDNINAIRLYERKGFSFAFDITDKKIAMMKAL